MIYYSPENQLKRGYRQPERFSNMKNEYIQGIVFLIVVISFTWLLYDTEDKTYPKDNQARASHIRETLPKMVSPIEIEEYFSSTRGGRTEIKFLVKRNPNNQEINFSFCKNQEFLYTSKRYNGKVILIWEYPQKQCQ